MLQTSLRVAAGEIHQIKVRSTFTSLSDVFTTSCGRISAVERLFSFLHAVATFAFRLSAEK